MKKIFVMIAATMMVLGFSSVYLVSCGGGGSSSGSGSKPGFSKGVITAKGSIFVNGIEYQTSGSSISMDNTTSHAESELEVGMVVKVKGSMSDDGVNGEGVEIEYEDNLEGPLTAVSGTTLPATLTVLDQAVLVDVNTHLSPTSMTFSALAGSVTSTPIVEVSGMTDNTGVIHATFIELKKSSPAAGDSIEIKGTIATGSTNTTVKTFKIGALNVDYSSAPLKDFPAGVIADGQFVEVKSTFGQYDAGTKTLVATEVQYNVELEPGENDEAEVEGFVSNYNAAAKTFTVSGISVNASGVASLPAIADGSIVEVEGTYSGGTLTAAKVVLKTTL
jgi:hypothetical protein